jgi:hypothetical protein
MPARKTGKKSRDGRALVRAARNRDPRSLEAVSELLMLAAIDRAERHSQKAGVAWSPIVDHLGFARSAATTRRLRPLVERLTDAGAVTRSTRHGSPIWGLTRSGRRRLARRRAEPLELPESPQHRQWRQARCKAEREIEALRRQVRANLAEANVLLDRESGGSQRWFALAQRLGEQCVALGSATYCLHEWAEPDDACSDTNARLLSRIVA